MVAAYLPVGPVGHGVLRDAVSGLDPVTCWSWRACPCCGELLPPRNLDGYESPREQAARLALGCDPFAKISTPWGPVTPGTTSPDHPDPARRMRFYLGTHRPHWLTFAQVPLFISINTLDEWRTTGDRWPTRKAGRFGVGVFAVDSGGFTELRDHGGWRSSADEYGAKIVRVIEEIGVRPVFVSPQDWMCEPVVISGGTLHGQHFVGTHLDVETHQRLTVANFLYLREHFPMVPWIPVLQGYTLAEYLRCVELYAEAGVNLAAEPLVGLGSVCRRDGTAEILEIVQALYDLGLRMHGFGCKTEGLPLYGHLLVSADSMSWSFSARPWSSKTPGIRLPECERDQAHAGYCNNCVRWALRWRENVLDSLRTPRRRRAPVTPAPAGRPGQQRRRRVYASTRSAAPQQQPAAQVPAFDTWGAAAAALTPSATVQLSLFDLVSGPS